MMLDNSTMLRTWLVRIIISTIYNIPFPHKFMMPHCDLSHCHSSQVTQCAQHRYTLVLPWISFLVDVLVTYSNPSTVIWSIIILMLTIIDMFHQNPTVIPPYAIHPVLQSATHHGLLRLPSRSATHQVKHYEHTASLNYIMIMLHHWAASDG